MKIAIDIFPLISPKTGVGYYTHHLLSEFIKIAPQNNYYLSDIIFFGQFFYNMVEIKNNSSKVDIIQGFSNILRVPSPFKTLTWILLSLYAKATGKTTKIKDIEIFFGTNFRGAFKKTLKNVITIHDMAHKYYPDTTSERIFKYLKKLPQAAEKADLIIAVSENTKKDILKFLDVSDKKIKVVYNGVDRIFRPIKNKGLLDVAKKKYNLHEKFILYLGAIQPRKNITGLIRAYGMLCKESNFKHKLVIGGGVGWKNKDTYTLIEEIGLKDKIVFTGYIPEYDLPLVYNLADIFVFPSFYEGFGLPVLEAMACGIPVVTSNSSSLPEIAGDAAVLIDPGSVNELAGGIRRILSDEDLRERNITKGLERANLFTWEKCARETLEAFSQVLSQR